MIDRLFQLGTDQILDAEVARHDPTRLAVARARAELRGFALNCTEVNNGRALYIASQQAQCREFDDLGEVEAWLDLIEGRAS